MHFFRVAISILVALVAWTLARPLETRADCPSAPVPIIITSPGCFRVVEDYSTNGPGQWVIHVEAPDVLIDLDGHTFRGSGQTSTAAGIYANNSPGLRIRGGAIDGFLFGVRVENETGSVDVRNMFISGGARGVLLRSPEVKVERSNFSNMHGYSGWPAAHTMAIEVFASRCRIDGNDIREIYPFSTGEIVGISVSAPADDCLVVNNSIVNSDRPEVVGRGIAFWLTGKQELAGVQVTGNRVVGFDYAFMASESTRAAFAGNEFIVTCLPGDVVTYDGAGANSFESFVGRCRDSVAYLRGMAANGDPEWRIRLAAALLEDQAGVGTEENRCGRAAEVVSILEPLLDMQQAQEQMKRIQVRASDCLASR